MCLEQSWLLHRTFNPEEVIPRWVRDPEGTQNSDKAVAGDNSLGYLGDNL